MLYELQQLIGNLCAAPAPSEKGIYYPATITGIRAQSNGDQVFIVRFNGTSGVDYEYKPYDLIGEHLSSVSSKTLQCGQNVYVDVHGKESIGIVRSSDKLGYYGVAIEGRNINVKHNEIRLLQRANINIRTRTQSDLSDKRRFSNRMRGRERSKDEFDVALTLANFNQNSINFSNATREEKDEHLENLSRNPNSVIQALNRSIKCERTSDEDSIEADSMEWNTPRNHDQEDDDPEIDVVRIDDSETLIDPLENLDESDMHSEPMEMDAQPKHSVIHRHQQLRQSPQQIHHTHQQHQRQPMNSTIYYTVPSQPNSSVPIQIGSLQNGLALQIVGESHSPWGVTPSLSKLRISSTNSPTIQVIPPTTIKSNPIQMPSFSSHSFQNQLFHQPELTHTAPSNSQPARNIPGRIFYDQNRAMSYTSTAHPYGHSPIPAASRSVASNSPKSAPVTPSVCNNTGSARSGIGAQSKKPGDGKKCRKIYGVNNKVEWCNQCKWKKACVKFPD